MPEAHKLAVILFADIAGYTAMMQEDEVAALIVLNRFKEIIEAKAPDHNGQVVQFFGDGALLAFDSSSKAVACAVAMQEAFRSTPHVPVRIGMHLGDVLFKEGNAFGNGVNVASRIESLGVPGAVLMSKVIRDQVKNKGDYQLTSLGSFEFKNVEEPTDVYALANPGFVVPYKSEMQGKLKKPVTGGLPMKLIVPILALVILGGILWVNLTNNAQASDLLPEEIRQEKVAVAVFNNFTNDPNLDALGNMASDWLSSGLRELGVKTTSPEMMRKYKDQVGILPGNAKGEVSLFELTDAQYVVTGSYYQKGDSLQVNSRLESTKTGDNLYDFPAIWGVIGQKEQLIVEIREQLKGYWTLKEADKLSKVNPPKYEAYKIFLNCGLINLTCLQDVLAIDTTFLLARIYLANAAISYENDSLYQEISNYVKRHFDSCTEYEQNLFSYVENMRNGNYKLALAAIDKNLKLDPRDLDIVYFSANGYLLLNQPTKTVERFVPFIDQYDVFQQEIRGEFIQPYFYALNRIGKHQEIIDLIERYPDVLEKQSWGEVNRAFMLSGRLKELYDRHQNWESISLNHIFHVHFPADSNNIFKPGLSFPLSKLTDPNPVWHYYFFSMTRLYNWWSKAFVYYLGKEWEQAEKILLGLKDQDWEKQAQGIIPGHLIPNIDLYMNTWQTGLLGCTYARQQKVNKAQAHIDKLESFRDSFPAGLSHESKGIIPYWQARIYAILGEKEKAVAQLNQSLKEGRCIVKGSFVWDWDLTNLKGYEPYEDLVRPK